MNADRFDVQRFIHKQVPFRYHQQDMFFHLSQELFSSFDIDTGSRHLLRAIEALPDLNSVKTVLDIGCGTGVLSVSLAKALPQARIYALDRDVLACAFTRLNAEENSTSLTVSPGLDVYASQAQFPEVYDLIVSNIPAKAGRKVIHRMINNALAQLSKEGVAAVVIISALKQLLEQAALSCECEIVLLESHPRHVVAIMKPAAQHKGDNSFPGAYLREEHYFTHKPSGGSYFLSAIQDLPGFDTTPLYASICASLVPAGPKGSRHFFWNTEQGHLPLQVLFSKTESAQAIIAGRDMLALAATQHNLCASIPHIPASLINAPSAADALEALQPASLESIWIYLDSRTDTLPPDVIDSLVSSRLSQGGMLCFTGKSSSLSTLPKRIPGFNRGAAKRHSGFRAQSFLKQGV